MISIRCKKCNTEFMPVYPDSERRNNGGRQYVSCPKCKKWVRVKKEAA